MHNAEQSLLESLADPILQPWLVHGQLARLNLSHPLPIHVHTEDFMPRQRKTSGSHSANPAQANNCNLQVRVPPLGIAQKGSWISVKHCGLEDELLLSTPNQCIQRMDAATNKATWYG